IAEIERLEKKIEQEKLRTPDREIAQMRKEHNNGETMYFRCFNCSENVIDYQVCQDQTGNIICRQCYHKTD
ncbi:4485_t:CDS:2, partial [Funneliformis geosporum]